MDLPSRVRGYIVPVIAAVMVSLLFAGCAWTAGKPPAERSVLVNRMTEKEKASVTSGPLSILEQTWEKPEAEEVPVYDGAWIVATPRNELLAQIDADDTLSAQDKAATREHYLAYPEDHIFIFRAVVDNMILGDYLPQADYDGGAGEYYASRLNDELIFESVTVGYSDFDDFKAKLRDTIDDECEAYVTIYAAGDPDPDTLEKYKSFTKTYFDDIYDKTVRLYQAVMDGDYNTMTNEEADRFAEALEKSQDNEEDGGDARWEFDAEAVEAIKDRITEYHMYDEELDLEFVIHAAIPPEYDENKSYPALVMTDAVWRFGDIPEMYREMESGKGTPAIIVTIGYDYGINGANNEFRLKLFCEREKQLLDFITDNMMPYLCENYAIDCSRSVLFGHSDAGVFSHYAAFNGDLYENDPFGAYIIGSPAFWNDYFHQFPEAQQYADEYGCFDRNETFDKKLFITGGKYEDEDYADYYNGNDSTLEGIEKLRQRLEAHGVKDYEVKLYDSHHYQYVHDMLIEYIDSRL